MRIYVAGPMSKYPLFNYPAFVVETARLRALWHEVVSPAEINAGREHEGWTACMRRDIVALTNCDAVRMLPGWKRSRGARIEHLLARTLGMRIFDVGDTVPDVRAMATAREVSA